MPEVTDEALMARVQHGDQDAFARLVDRHLAGLQRFLTRLSGNSADADELCQETMLRLWSQARRWQPDRVKLSTWLYRIARNLAIDHYRKHRTDQSDAVDELADEAPDAATLLDEDRRDAWLRSAVAALPERQRTALLLCHFDGFSNADAAQVLQVSVDALESLLARARRTLKSTLSPLRAADEIRPCPQHR